MRAYLLFMVIVLFRLYKAQVPEQCTANIEERLRQFSDVIRHYPNITLPKVHEIKNKDKKKAIMNNILKSLEKIDAMKNLTSIIGEIKKKLHDLKVQEKYHENPCEMCDAARKNATYHRDIMNNIKHRLLDNISIMKMIQEERAMNLTKIYMLKKGVDDLLEKLRHIRQAVEQEYIIDRHKKILQEFLDTLFSEVNIAKIKVEIAKYKKILLLHQQNKLLNNEMRKLEKFIVTLFNGNVCSIKIVSFEDKPLDNN